MNRYQIRQEVRRILRDSDYPKEDIDRAINSVISTLNQLGKFKFNESAQDISLVASDKDYALTNFISETSVVFAPGTDDEALLTKIAELTAAFERGWFTDTGDEPTYYAIWDGQMLFEPIPNATAAGKTVRVYGYFNLATISSDVTACELPDKYCISVLAWGAAAEIDPSLAVTNNPRGKNIGQVFMVNLQSMLATESFESKVSYQIRKDHRWSGFYDKGHVTSVR